MNKEQIVEALKSGKQIEVAHTWYYNDLYMTCSGSDWESGYVCCADSYSSYEEAADDILCKADTDKIEIKD